MNDIDYDGIGDNNKKTIIIYRNNIFVPKKWNEIKLHWL